MEVWLWIGAYVLGMLAVQMLLYRYRRRHREQRPSAVGPLEPYEAVGFDADARAPDRDADVKEGRRCPRCGAVNEPDGAFSFCRNCVAPLDG